MRIAHLSIKNFRCISEAQLWLPKHAVLIGDNNSGKSSVIEAIDLVLGPDRINRLAAIDEHDFYASRYLDAEGNPVLIEVEVTIVDLSSEQIRHFRGNLEFWDDVTGALLQGPPIGAIEQPSVKEALRVGFRGWYEADDDDFKVQTFFCSPPQDNGEQPLFRTPDKRLCGFLLLRALRTGSRALSLERGSLLDIILRVHELRPKMWEKVLEQLRVSSSCGRSRTGGDANSLGRASRNPHVRSFRVGGRAAPTSLRPDTRESATDPHRVHGNRCNEWRCSSCRTVSAPRKRHDQYARAGLTVDDRRREKDRHFRDGGA